MTSPRRSPPPPLEGNDWLITVVITAGWAVALIVLGIMYGTGTLPSAEHWWLWTCVTGAVLGFWGLWYVPRLKRNRARAAERRAAAQLAAREGPGNELPGSEPPAQVPPENDSKTVSSSDTPGRSTRS